jgi:hypothetical protein
VSIQARKARWETTALAENAEGHLSVDSDCFLYDALDASSFRVLLETRAIEKRLGERKVLHVSNKPLEEYQEPF